jgi:hypothetical protein
LELKLNTSLPIQFEKQEESEDSRFTKVKISILHTGKNLNNSIFNKNIVEDALPSLANIPIVGYISTDKLNESDFNGHEQRIVIDKDGVKFEYLGRVYGIIPETNNAQFEMKTVDGVEREYLTCEGLLYNKFPEAIEIFERDGQKPQSMELESSSIEGKFNKNGVYEFSKFKFEAACVLGENVTPAMTGSLIEKFSVSTMQDEVKELLAEFNKNFTNFTSEISKEGGENVDKKLEMLGQFSQLGEEILEQVKLSLESYSVEELESKLLQMSEAEPRQEETPVDEFTQDEPKTDDVPDEFALSGKQLESEIRNALSKEKYTDDWGWESRLFWFVDYDENRVIAEESKENRLVSLNYSLNGDFVEIDFASKKPVKISYVDMEGESIVGFALTSTERKEFELNQKVELTTKEVEDKFSEDKKEIETAQEELTTLREFKAGKDKEEKLSVIEKFSELPEDVVKPFIEGIDTYSKDELELNLLAEVGKLNLTFSKKSVKKNGNDPIVSLTNFETTKTNVPSWFSLVEEYKQNKN